MRQPRKKNFTSIRKENELYRRKKNLRNLILWYHLKKRSLSSSDVWMTLANWNINIRNSLNCGIHVKKIKVFES